MGREDGEAIYSFIKSEDEKSPYHQRTTEVEVLTAGEESGVQAASLNTPCIFDEGTGLFNKQGLVIPGTLMYVVQHGYGFKLNDTCNFDWVHVEDLTDVYVLLMRTILEREDRGVGYTPSGKKGVIFPAAERVMHSESCKSASMLILKLACSHGLIPQRRKRSDRSVCEKLRTRRWPGTCRWLSKAWRDTKARREQSQRDY